MNNKLIRKKPNRLLTGRNNYYNFGSFMNTVMDTIKGTPKDGKLTTGAFKGMSTEAVTGLKAAGTAVGLLGGGLIGGGMTSGAGNVLQGLSSVAAAIPGPWGAVACLCEGQRVITRDGRFVNIEDLTPEDGIIGFSEQTNSIAPQTTTLQMLEFYKPCVRIELQSGLNLECSTDHPVYIADSGRATRKYVDGIRTRVKTYSYVKAGDIKTGQYAGVIDKVPIFGNLNVEKAYLIGMLIGDGSYTKRSIVALHTGDKDTWNYVESNNYGVVVNRFDSGEKYSKEFRTYRITEGCQMMRRLGLYGQSKCTKTLPNNIHLWNKESIANLIAGLWDTDGYVTIESNGKKKYRICFCQSNLSLIRAVQEQLIKFGIHSSIKINKPKKSVIKDKQVNSKEAYVLIIKDKKSCERFIENIHLNISYKQRNLDRIKEITKAKFTKDNSFRQGVHADKVISITPIGVQRIYNLEAHQDHNYIANFIVTHNSAGLGIMSGITNRMFGSKMNEENIAKVESNIDKLNSFQSNASDFDSLTQNWSNAAVGTTFDDSFIGEDGWFSNKAKNKAAALREQVEVGNAWIQNTLNNNAKNISTTQMQNLLANYAALGGPLFFAEGGGIHIKPENRGKFTETKRRTGKTTEELTHSKNPLTRKRAIFALNAKKWHHAFGGDLMTHGADFDTGLTLVSNGGSHESNPYEGVPMGVDQEGTPNLVEEGEVIFNDYVFSKRLKVPKAMRNKYKLRGNKPLTFADAALLMSKEAEERPNDPISKNGLEALLGDLAYAQEGIREKKQAKKTYAYGGELGNIFEGDGPELNRLRHNNTNIDFSHLYKKGSKYMTNRDYVLKNWDTPYVQKWRQQFIDAINDYNKGLDGFNPYTLDSMTLDEYKRLSLDERYGAVHSGTLALDPSKDTIIKHTLRGADGPTALDPAHAYYVGYSPTTKKTWAEDFKDMYTMVNNGKALMSVDPETGANVLEYLYDPVKKKEPPKPKKFRFYDYADKYDKDSPYREYDSLDAALLAGEDLTKFGAPQDGEEVTVYRGLRPPEEMPEFDNELRYAPIIGSLTGLGLSLSSKPDESGAEAILEASRGAGTYQPVKFSPVGNYLTYNPFDLDFAINQANAESAAARRALMNTSGGNRAQAMAGILAADNNALNQLGALRRGAAEDNLRQRQLVEDFNRATNEFNSEGFFKADVANQSALAQARDLSLRGTMAAEEMRQRAKLARDNAIQANLSNLFTSIGNVGQENVVRQQMKFAFDHGMIPGLGSKEKAKGGKIKRKKKGLTY